MAEKKSKSLWDAKIIRRALVDAVVKLDPRTMMKNPVMFVVEVGSVVTTMLLFREKQSFAFNLQITLWLWFTVLFANFAEAMAEGRGKAQADTLRKARSETEAKRLLANGTTETVPSSQAAFGRCRDGRRGRNCSGRWRSHRRRRLGGRVRDHRRIRARDSRSRRRPLGGYRRHARAFRPDQSPHHFESRRNFPRPNDRFGRGRRAPEDSQRNRAQHSAGGPDHHFPAGRGYAAAFRDLLGIAADGICARLAAGLPDSDHHRRLAFRDRHCRHGSPGAAQRARHVRARRRSCRRREHFAAR